MQSGCAFQSASGLCACRTSQRLGGAVISLASGGMAGTDVDEDGRVFSARRFLLSARGLESPLQPGLRNRRPQAENFFAAANVFGPAPIQGQWREVQGALGLVPATAQSARLTIQVQTNSTAADALTRFDDVFLGTDPPIFTDGFETGDLGRWSAVVP
ncbi:MAG: hypothetical protein AAF772_11995 [Acidobacteriota bacterium]